MRSGTPRGLGLTSLPVALRVKLKWSVSHLGDWCEVCPAWVEGWALGPTLWHAPGDVANKPSNALDPDESLSTMGNASLPRLASFYPETTWFC